MSTVGGSNQSSDIQGEDQKREKIMAQRMVRQRSSSMSTSQQNKNQDFGSKRMSMFDAPDSNDNMRDSNEFGSQDFANKRSSRVFDDKRISSINAMVQGPTVRQNDLKNQIAIFNKGPDNERDFNIHAKSYHYYAPQETAMCCEWINESISPHQDPDLAHLFPDGQPLPVVAPQCDEKFFQVCKDGLLLSKVIECVVPGSIDFKLMKKNPKNKIHITENIQVMLNGAKAIGVKMNNIGPEDVHKGVPHLVLALCWQIIKIGLLAKISIRANPLLSKLLSDTEKTGDVSKITNEALLQKWVNFHLSAANCQKKLTNFTSDLKDGQILAELMLQLSKAQPDLFKKVQPLYDLQSKEQQALKRSEFIMSMADQLDVRKLMTAEDIVNGNKEHAIAFIAQLLNEFPNLEESMNAKVSQVAESVDNLNLQQKAMAANIASIQDFEQKVQNLTRLNQDQSNEIENFKKRIKELENRVQDQDIEISHLKETNADLQQKLSDSESQKQAFANQNTEILNSIYKYEVKIKQFYEDNEELKARLIKEAEVKTNLSKELIDTQNKFNQHIFDSQRLIEQLRDGSTQSTKNEILLTDLQKTSVRNQYENEKMQAILQRLKDILNGNQEKIHEFDEIPKAIGFIINQKSRTQIDLDNCKRKLQDLDIQLQQKDQNVLDVTKQSEKAIKELQNQLDTQINEYESYKLRTEQLIRQKEQEIQLYESRMKSSMSNLEMSKSDFEDLQRIRDVEVPKLKQNIIQLKSDLEVKQSDIELWKKTCQILRNENESKRMQENVKLRFNPLGDKMKALSETLQSMKLETFNT